MSMTAGRLVHELRTAFLKASGHEDGWEAVAARAGELLGLGPTPEAVDLQDRLMAAEKVCGCAAGRKMLWEQIEATDGQPSEGQLRNVALIDWHLCKAVDAWLELTGFKVVLMRESDVQDA